MIKTKLSELLNIDYPIIMAPMFLVTTEEMMIAGVEQGIATCIPTLNYRTEEELKSSLQRLRKECKKGLGVNLIVNQSNSFLKAHKKIVLDCGVDFIITSLGSPKEIIADAHKSGIKVFCDVTEDTYAKRVEDLGADAIIAVNSGAGGHAGEIPASILVPMLKESCKIPVISAGGVGTGAGLLSMLALGADGVSIGSPFIPTKECKVTKEYKQACIDYGAKDIVRTTKLSGTPCTVIKTPYVEKIGTDQNLIENILNKNKQLKKYAKMLTYYKGMKLLEKAAFGATYKSVWCAGPSIEFTESNSDVKTVIQKITKEYNLAFEKMGALKND
jgi:nitronate monooxygenase